MRPGVFDRLYVIEQLRSLGRMQTCEVGWPALALPLASLSLSLSLSLSVSLSVSLSLSLSTLLYLTHSIANYLLHVGFS